MAYCRYSTDDFRSDVHVFEDVSGGWTTMIAEVRYIDGLEYRNGLPVIPSVEGETFAEKMSRMSQYLVDIEIEGAGEVYNDATIGECITRLEGLRERGFHVPQVAFDRLLKEQAEAQ